MFLDYDENYSVSSEGEIFSKRYNRILEGNKNSHGYYRIDLYGKSINIHRLVGLLFLPKIDMPDLMIDHINQDKTDNRACNLRWCSRGVNRMNTGLCKTNKSGQKHIFFDKHKNCYKVSIQNIYYGSSKTLEEAIKKRDEVYNALSTRKNRSWI